MTGVAVAVAVVVVAGDLAVLIASWRSRSVLAGVCAVAGLALLVVTRDPYVSLLALLIGAVLYGLGQLLERLIDGD